MISIVSYRIGAMDSRRRREGGGGLTRLTLQGTCSRRLCGEVCQSVSVSCPCGVALEVVLCEVVV